MISKISILALRSETSGDGVYAAPTGAGCFRVEDLDIDTDLDPDEPNWYSKTLSKEEDVPGKRTCTITGKIHMACSGSTSAVMDEPEWADVVKACGGHFTQTTGATSSITILPHPNPGATGTSFSGIMNINGKNYIAAGLRGNGVWNMEVGKRIKFDFSLQGSLWSVSDVGILTPSGLDAINGPTFMNAVTAFSYDSYQALISRLTLDMGNEVVQNESPSATGGVLSFGITDRNPRGEMDPRECTTGTYDFWTKALAITKGVIAFKIGSTANYITFGAPAAQLPNYKRDDRNGWLINNAPVKYLGSSGDDEWQWTLSER